MSNPDYQSDPPSSFLVIWSVIAAVILLCILAYCQYRREPPKVVEQPVVQVYSVPIIHPSEKVVKPAKKKVKRQKVDTTCTPNGIDCGAIMTINGQPVMDDALRLYY